LLALEHLLADGDSNAFNLGNGKGFSVHEVIDTARRVTGQAIPAATQARRPGDPAVLVADSQKVRRELGWQPRYEDLGTIIGHAWECGGGSMARLGDESIPVTSKAESSLLVFACPHRRGTTQ
jgi:UDP-glucose 4-epimerase